MFHNFVPPNPKINNDCFKYRPNTRNGQSPRFNQHLQNVTTVIV